MAQTHFDGFDAKGLAILADLEDTNTKAFFDAHRDTFRDGVVEPAKALVTDLGERLRRSVAPDLVAEPRVNGSLFRINRDIRFSADKSPYKTQQAMFLWEGADKKSSPGFYLSVGGHEVGVGVGYMALPDLDRWRAAIAGDDARLRRVVCRALRGLRTAAPVAGRAPRLTRACGAPTTVATRRRSWPHGRVAPRRGARLPRNGRTMCLTCSRAP